MRNVKLPECSLLAETLRELGYWKAKYMKEIGEMERNEPEVSYFVYTPFTEE